MTASSWWTFPSSAGFMTRFHECHLSALAHPVSTGRYGTAAGWAGALLDGGLVQAFRWHHLHIRSTRCYIGVMGRIISQRELRNDSARVLRAVDEGQSFVITRREKPVGELIPLHRDRFVDRHVVERVFAASPQSTGNPSSVTLTVLLTKELSPVTDSVRETALLDTSVVIDLPVLLKRGCLPGSLAIFSITMAELTAGPAATDDPRERARRQDRLQRVEATFEPIPFGISAARAYGQIFAAVRSCRRQPRKRFADLLIASIALAEELPLITRNSDDFVGLDDLVEVITV